MAESIRWTEREKQSFISLISSLNKAELELAYTIVRDQLKAIYEKTTETHFKFCDKCDITYPKSTDKCGRCGGGLREFEVPFDNYFL